MISSCSGSALEGQPTLEFRPPPGEPKRRRRFALPAHSKIFATAFCITFLFVAPSAIASAPSIGSVRPIGVTRGTECTLEIAGSRLGGVQELHFYEDGIDVVSLAAGENTNEKLFISVQVQPDCRIGRHLVRVRTPYGMSNFKYFQVGPFPNVSEVEPNSEFQSPQEVGLGVTVNGIVESEDVDYYTFHASKGQRISAEIEAMRLAHGLFDSYIAVLDSNRFELAASDDTAKLKQDGSISVIAPDDGKYTVEVRETAYRGSGGSHYRLHVGTSALPTVAYPPGGPLGESITVECLGDVTGPFPETLDIPAAEGTFPFFPTGQGVTPSPVLMRASPFPNAMESEPNNGIEDATRVPYETRFACNGVISEPGDVDHFIFSAKKGEVYDVDVFARRLGSPLDAVMQVLRVEGNSNVGSNDDTRGLDAYGRITIPEDGEYRLMIRDHLDAGGEDYVYRAEVSPVRPSLEVRLPHFDDNNRQARQTIVVPRGNRIGIPFIVSKADFSGPVTIEPLNLPAGISYSIPEYPINPEQIPVIFEATGDAPLAGALINVRGTQKAEENPVSGDYRQSVDLVWVQNKGTYITADIPRMAVSVAERAPFSVRAEVDAVPIVHGGAADIRVIATRDEGFAETIRCKMLFTPPGIGRPEQIEIPGDQAEAIYRVNADGNARPGIYPLIISAAATHNGGETWVCTPPVNLEVKRPYVTGSIDMAAVQQGKEVEVVCTLNQQDPFPGEASIRLVGLPARTSTESITINTNTVEAVFKVIAEPDSPTGKHKTLFCMLDVPHSSGTIPHTLGALGTLRIDPPPKVEPEQTEPEPEPEPEPVAEEAPPKKRLTRLEQLRLDAKEKAARGT
jgi:hypothetical protein